MKYIIYIFLIYFCFVNSEAGERQNNFYVDIILNNHFFNGNFKNLGGLPDCCPDNRTGNGFTPKFIIGTDLPLWEEPFLLNLGFNRISGRMKHEENTFILINDSEELGKFEHSINFSFYCLSLELAKKISFSDFSTTIGTGGYFLIQSNYEQSEKLVAPFEYGVFSNTRTRLRNQSSGDVRDKNVFLPFIFVDLAYTFIRPTENQMISLNPYIHFELSLTSLLRQETWKYYSIGVGIKFTIQTNVDKTN